MSTDTIPAPRPFLKWPGGKAPIADKILAAGPKEFDRYVELFLGGGAVFFALRAKGWTGPALLCDVNASLVIAYRIVRDEPTALLRELAQYTIPTQKEYLQIREDFRRAMREGTIINSIEHAARLIILNKTCFNGIWRESKTGRFNSPFGYRKKPNLCDTPTILAASRALQRCQIERAPFTKYAARPGDFVYSDPPYIPRTKTANFTSYSADGFSWQDQQNLRAAAKGWAMAGAHVVLSQADIPLARKLYRASDGFKIRRVMQRRNINRNGADRGPVGELIITAK
jgi:DNA adenine methylase